jgi:molybdenum cofactor biosynthesis enzyme MoaA
MMTSVRSVAVFGAAAGRAVALARRRKVYINMVVHRDTREELEPMLRFCEARGIGLNAQAVMFGKEYQDGSARSAQELTLTDGWRR